MDAVQRIVTSLKFNSRGTADLAAQVLEHLTGPEALGPVLRTLAVLKDWPEVGPCFARLVRRYPAEWLAELRSMGEVQRLDMALASLDVLGGVPTAVLKEVDALVRVAEAELARRKAAMPISLELYRAKRRGEWN